MLVKIIGLIRTPHKNLEEMPIQPKGAAGVTGVIVLDEDYASGLADLGGFSHIYLIYQFHKATRTEMEVIPFMDSKKRGVFATRSPLRPNHIGLSIVELVSVDGLRITVCNVDMLDKTPLLDIKPYIKEFDHMENTRSGWLKATGEDLRQKRSDNRFI